MEHLFLDVILENTQCVSSMVALLWTLLPCELTYTNI